MAALADMRTAIVEALRVKLGAAAKTVEAYEGALEPEELKRVFRATPAVLLVCPGIASVEDFGGSVVALPRWALFVLTSDADARKRGEQALALAEAALAIVVDSPWGFGNKVEQLRAENLYNAAVDQLGVALWAITWQQGFEFTMTVNSAAFTRFHADWDLAPTDDATDAQDDVSLESP
jgi:phage gp37-like protein